jgi:hypothetical protein
MRNDHASGEQRSNFIGRYEDVLGFTNPAATALYDVQMLKNKETLAELNDRTVDNICRSMRRDSN